MTITRINPPVNGQAITPASVAATGDVTAVKNGTTYSLGTLGESVSQLENTSTGVVTFTANSGWSYTINLQHRVGAVMFVYLSLRTTSAVSSGAGINPIKVTGARDGIAASDKFSGHVGGNGQVWARALTALSANTDQAMMLMLLI